MAWCFVSPASRGIGFALTRHLLQTTKAPILATSRSNTEDVRSSLLDGLKNIDEDRLTVLELDCIGKSCPNGPDVLELPSREAFLTIYRRIHHLHCRRPSQADVPPQNAPPPSRLRHPRRPTPREIPGANRLPPRHRNFQGKHHRPAPDPQALLRLPPSQERRPRGRGGTSRARGLFLHGC